MGSLHSPITSPCLVPSLHFPLTTLVLIPFTHCSLHSLIRSTPSLTTFAPTVHHSSLTYARSSWLTSPRVPPACPPLTLRPVLPHRTIPFLSLAHHGFAHSIHYMLPLVPYAPWDLTAHSIRPKAPRSEYTVNLPWWGDGRVSV